MFQNSKKKHPEIAKEFGSVMVKVISHLNHLKDCGFFQVGKNFHIKSTIFGVFSNLSTENDFFSNLANFLHLTPKR